jgi:hypothetical protein
VAIEETMKDLQRALADLDGFCKRLIASLDRVRGDDAPGETEAACTL